MFPDRKNPGPHGGHSALYLALALALAVAVLYFPSLKFDFINIDDPEYVTQNETVISGLAWTGVKAASTKIIENYWIPLTWFSLMLDSQAFGTDASGFHFTNVLLHTVNSLLLFVFLHRATGSAWKSFFAASLWALHPLRVESVVWITSRKDVLSGVFFFCCLLFYSEYAKSRRASWYLASLAAMLAGLASKPVLVVVPLVLLSVDLWPLKRFCEKPAFGEVKRITVEKIPFFALSAIFSAVTLYTQKSSLKPLALTPLSSRLAGFAASYLRYLGKTLWPSGLALESSESAVPFALPAALAAGLLLAATLFFWRARKVSAAIPAGWLWYLAALLPVSGIVSVGVNNFADRFTYLPLAGIAIMAVWGIDAAIGERETVRRAASLACLFLALALSTATAGYMRFWKDSVTLGRHLVSVNDSAWSERVLASALSDNGNHEEALALFAKSLEKNPSDPLTYRNLGILYSGTRRYQEALEAFEKYLSLSPGSVDARFNIAASAMELGLYGLAQEHLDKGLRVEPENWRLVFNMGLVFGATGRLEEAHEYLTRADRLHPRDAGILNGLGTVLARKKRFEEAAFHFGRALALDPLNSEAKFNLALSLYESGQLEKAGSHFKKIIELEPGNAGAHFYYGLILKKTGRKEEAARQQKEVLRLSPGNEAALKELGGTES
ncbi:tetratricopeptide repeat protein [bacterium]|nr:MAG: tetratricopeptide repeat protein [bacterium]